VPLFTADGRRLRVTEDLARVRAACAEGPVRLSDLAAGDRGFALVLFLLAIPFVLPFPTLGLATPVGFALALAALGLVAGRPVRLPRRLGSIALAPAVLDRAHGAASRLSRVAARVTRPRLPGVLSMRAALGVSLFASAVVLGLPIPLPLSNFLPAGAILLLAGGMLEEDGLLVLAGHGAALAVCAVVVGSGAAAWAAGAAVFGI
jgi:hypothetical protein